MSLKSDILHDFKAIISLSADSRPKPIKAATKTAIGIDKANIQAKLRAKTSRITGAERPLTIIIFIISRMKSMIKTNVTTASPNRNGQKSSLMVYLQSIFIT